MDDPWDDDPFEEEEPSPQAFLLTAFLFGCGMALVAWLLGWAFSQQPPAGLDFLQHSNGKIAAAVGWGLLAAIPMASLFLLIDLFAGAWFDDIREIAETYVGPMFVELDAAGLLLVALATGVGEEMLFRGFLQGWLAGATAGAWGPWVALAVAAMVFGLCHYLSFSYFVMATLLGAYLGAVWIWTGSLLAPIVAHAAYDFLALWYITRISLVSLQDEAEE